MNGDKCNECGIVVGETTPVAHTLIHQLYEELAKARACISEVTNERDALLPVYSKVDELLTAIEAAQEDVGHRPVKDIIAELGPLWSAAEDALPEAPK